MTKKSLEFEKYQKLKEKKLSLITRENAVVMLKKTKQTLLKKLEKLNINHLDEVEDLYLTALQYSHSATIVWCNNNATENQISFNLARENFSVDILLELLLNDLKTELGLCYLSKINNIHKKYLKNDSETLYAWEAIHLNFLNIHHNVLKPEIQNVLDQLDLIQEYSKKTWKSYSHAKNLSIKIQGNIDTYIVDHDKQKLILNCKEAIKKARPILEKEQQGFKKLLDELIFAILKTFSIIKVPAKGNAFFFTSSEDKKAEQSEPINQLESIIDGIAKKNT